MIPGMREDAMARIEEWWDHRGLVSAIVPPRFGVDSEMTCEASYLHPEESARRRDVAVRNYQWHGESIPHVSTYIGPGSLAIFLGSEPETVEAALAAINQVYFDVFDRLYALIRGDAGEMMYGPFMLYGSGKTAKVQCDGSAMFSPDMFERFVLPSLKEQCGYLDRAMYHLDGTQCIGHLDHVLSLEEIDAVEWTPQAGAPQGTDPQWYPMYRKILEAGKSVQILVDDPSLVPGLLNEIGTEGVFLLGYDLEGGALAEMVERFR